MPYYKQKPTIQKPLKSEIITHQLVSKIIELGYPSFNGNFLKEFGFFGYDCKKENRYYKSILNDNQFYQSNYIRIYFSWPDIEASQYKDFYIVFIDNKIDLRFWDRNFENDRNQFEHHAPITDVNLISQIEKCFEKILTYKNISNLKNAVAPVLSKTKINYKEVLELLNLIVGESSKELEILAENMVKANNNPEVFIEPKENLHWELLSNSDLLEKYIIQLDWKCAIEDIIWAIEKSSRGEIILKSNSFNKNVGADENFEIADELINKNFTKYITMYLDFPADTYFIFIAKKNISGRIIELGKRCRIPIAAGF